MLDLLPGGPGFFLWIVGPCVFKILRFGRLTSFHTSTSGNRPPSFPGLSYPSVNLESWIAAPTSLCSRFWGRMGRATRGPGGLPISDSWWTPNGGGRLGFRLHPFPKCIPISVVHSADRTAPAANRPLGYICGPKLTDTHLPTQRVFWLENRRYLGAGCRSRDSSRKPVCVVRSPSTFESPQRSDLLLRN